MAGNHVLLETIELTQTATAVTFDNLPSSGYTDLKIVCSVRGTGSSNYIGCNVLLNGTSASLNWGRLQIEGGDATVNSYTSTSSSLGYFPDGNFTANTFGTSILYIPNYRSSDYKTINVESAGEAASTSAVYMDMFSQTWFNTSAITSIQIGNATSPLAVGCTFSLYGVAATGTTPVTAPRATGGNIVANDGTYWYHAFLTSGNFVPQTPLTCDALVVAGGGGGGANYGAGGGAGGLLTFTSQSIAASAQTVTIGAGGPSAPSNTRGSAGSNSVFGSLTACVGGGGGGGNSAGQYNGGSGGSGGGGGGLGGSNATGGAGTSGQGNAGASQTGAGAGSGGGGAGAAGSGVNAGIGATSALINAMGAATSTGELSGGNYYFAGGGLSYSAGTRGLGGGAAIAGSGTVNTGGGGGGDGYSVSKGGGSGIVIIRYPMA